MLLLAFALAGATVGPAPDIQRAKRVKVVRVPARAKPHTVRIPISAPRRDPNQNYRIGETASDRIDGKDVAVRQTGLACGTTGAPVCPSNGTQVVKAALDD